MRYACRVIIGNILMTKRLICNLNFWNKYSTLHEIPETFLLNLIRFEVYKK